MITTTTPTALPFFVYGTLRPGQRNFRRFLADVATCVEAASLPEAAMFEGPGFPYVTDGAGIVEGDLIMVRLDRYEAMLGRLDRLEGYRGAVGPNHYDRARRHVTIARGAVDAWVYLASRRTSLGPRIESGDWLEGRPVLVGEGRQ